MLMRNTNIMAKRTAAPTEDFAVRGIQSAREQFEEVLGQTEQYVRKNPGQAMLYAFVAGYVLNRLPVGRVVGGLFRLSLFALRPAVLVNGATKLYRLAQDEE
jgi:hypothetical protein